MNRASEAFGLNAAAPAVMPLGILNNSPARGGLAKSDICADEEALMNRLLTIAVIGPVLMMPAGLAPMSSGSALPVLADPPAAELEGRNAEFWRRYRELAAAGQPETGANVIDLVEPLQQRMTGIQEKVLKRGFPGAGAADVDLQALTREPANPREQEIARAVLAEMADSDVPARMAEFAAAPRNVMPMGSGLLIEQPLPHLGRFRYFARYESGRMTLAQERSDTPEWLVAFDETMRLGELTAREPTLISVLVGIAVQALGMDAAQRLIAHGCDHATLMRIEAVVRAHPIPGLDRALRGEELMATDALEFVYAAGAAGLQYLQHGSGRGGEVQPRPAMTPAAEDQRLLPGKVTLAEERRMVQETYARWRQWAASTASERGSAEWVDEAREKTVVLELTLVGVENTAKAWDRWRADRAGLLTVIAIERFRMEKGKYPGTLTEIGGEGPREFTVDPYHGGPLGYLPPGSGPYPGGLPYVLYAAGPDGRDDGGRVDFENPVSGAVNAGGDYLINRYPPAAGDK